MTPDERNFIRWLMGAVTGAGDPRFLGMTDDDFAARTALGTAALCSFRGNPRFTLADLLDYLGRRYGIDAGPRGRAPGGFAARDGGAARGRPTGQIDVGGLPMTVASVRGGSLLCVWHDGRGAPHRENYGLACLERVAKRLENAHLPTCDVEKAMG